MRRRRCGHGRAPVFDATITPHRSLGQNGFRLVMTLVCLASIVSSIPFMVLGAWPVAGFFGLDVARAVHRLPGQFPAARAFERDRRHAASRCCCARSSHRGEEANWRFNPAWTKLEREIDEDYGLLKLSLVSRGRSVPVADALSPDERAGFADALGAALAQARRGVDYQR